MSVDARLPERRKKVASSVGIESKHIVSPGDVITEDTGYMRLVLCYKLNEKQEISCRAKQLGSHVLCN